MSNPFHGAKPYQIPHIQALLRALLYCGAALDASDTGTGKTYSTLITARILGVVPFVLGPKAAKNEWERAAKVVGHPVEFMNYEKARMEKYGLGFLKPHGSGSYWQWTRQFSMLVFDEVHRCSGSTSATGKLLRSAKKAAPYVVGLSATAAENALHLKNLGTALGLFETKNYYNWLLKHGVKPGIFGGFSPDEDPEVSEHAMKKIHDQIFPKRGARMRRALIPDFPKTLIDVQFVDASEETAKLVESVHEKEESGRAAFDEDYHKERQRLDWELIEPTVEMALDSIKAGRKVAIFPKYVETLDELLVRLRDECFTGFIDGRQTGAQGEKQRKEFQDAFQNNELDAIIVNQQAGSAALSLHDPTGKVERDVYVFPTDSGRTLKQLLGRAHRTSGAFSRQFLLGFAGTIQEEILLRSLDRIRMIDTLNDREVESLRLI